MCILDSGKKIGARAHVVPGVRLSMHFENLRQVTKLCSGMYRPSAARASLRTSHRSEQKWAEVVTSCQNEMLHEKNVSADINVRTHANDGAFSHAVILLRFRNKTLTCG